MELRPIFNISFFDYKGVSTNSPVEWIPVSLCLEFELENWDLYKLRINGRLQDLSLKNINGQKKLVTDYIRYSAGTYKIEVTIFNYIYINTFTVYPNKISEESFSFMLEDLVYKLPADISVSLNYLGAFSGINIVSNDKITIAQEVLRLKTSFYGRGEKLGLKKILDIIANNPYHVLKTNEIWVNREEVRNPNTSKIAHSLMHTQNISSLGKPIKIIDKRVQHSFNVYENQMIKLYVHQFKTKLRLLIKLFKITNNKRFYIECELLNKELLNSIRKAHFLDEVELPVNFTFKPTMVLLNVPIYRAALNSFLEFQKVITTNITSNEIDSPLENTPSLYQKWGTLKVLSILLKVAPKLGFVVEKQRLETKVMGGKTIKILSDGKAILKLIHPINKTIIKFFPERSYVKNGRRLKSISYTQRPDIALEITNQYGETKVYIFDPKYKLESDGLYDSDNSSKGKPKKVDIDKMHAYRDSIQDINGNRVVEFAATLYPGDTIFYDKGLAAIRLIPSEEDNQELVTILERILEEM